MSLPDADGFMYDDASSSSGSENRSTELLVTEAEGNAIKVRTYRPVVLGSIFSLAVLCAALTFWFIGEHEEDQSASTVGVSRIFFRQMWRFMRTALTVLCYSTMRFCIVSKRVLKDG